MLDDAGYLGTEKHKKNTEEFYCDSCLFSTSHKGMWNRHIKTKKHNAGKMLDDAGYLGTEKHEKHEDKWHCTCGKKYSHNQSYYRHKATCTYEPPSAKEADMHNQVVSSPTSEQIEILCRENKELRKLLTEQSTQMMDMAKTIATVAKNAGNHNTISTNSHNTNIILQLNSNYPNALPIQYLIDQIKGNPKCVTHDPKLYAQAFIEALSQQTNDEKTIRAIKDTMYVKYEETGFKEDKEVEVFDTLKKETELDQLGKAAKQNANMFSREKDSKEYPELVSGIMKPLTQAERKQMKKQVLNAIGNE